MMKLLEAFDLAKEEARKQWKQESLTCRITYCRAPTHDLCLEISHLGMETRNEK